MAVGPLFHAVLAEQFKEPGPLRLQFPLELRLPQRVWLRGQSLVAEAGLIGDFGGAEFRNHQVRDRSDALRFGDDQGALAPPNTSMFQPSSSIQSLNRFLMVTSPPRRISSPAMRASMSRLAS